MAEAFLLENEFRTYLLFGCFVSAAFVRGVASTVGVVEEVAGGRGVVVGGARGVAGGVKGVIVVDGPSFVVVGVSVV